MKNSKKENYNHKRVKRHACACACIINIATPVGEGGIGIIRISGDGSHEIGLDLVCIKKIKAIKEIEYNKMYYAHLKTETVKDEVLCVFFKAPYSYTGENVVEIHCHGSLVILNEVIKAAVKSGKCRISENGEFTKRAFYNNKIDLTKAEGIIDIIKAQSLSEVNAAYEMLSGGVYKKISSIEEQILEVLAQLSVVVDYPEEDIEEESYFITAQKIDDILNVLNELIASFSGGQMLKNGVKIAILGKPNVGKSMLLNALINKDRAIVTDIEGTTRDTLEESFSYKGSKFIIVDTAGLRETDNIIERSGIIRSYSAAKESDIILIVSNADDEYIVGDSLNEIIKEKTVIFVKNKLDLCSDFNKSANNTQNNTVFLSALTGKNIDILKEMLYNVSYGRISTKGAMLTNLRQFSAAREAHSFLSSAKNAINNSLTADCIISDLNMSYKALGEITGTSTSETVINKIFAQFCVGK